MSRSIALNHMHGDFNECHEMSLALLVNFTITFGEKYRQGHKNVHLILTKAQT